MGQLDNKFVLDSRRGIKNRSATTMSDLQLDNISVTGITSRDDIIDPYQLVDQSNYRNTIAGRRAYESDLARAIEIQKQQMASYEEWYNSPEQAAIRERAAGINPDLAGLDNAGSAALPDAASATPGSELPTTGQNVLDTANSVMSIMQTLGSLSALPLQFQSLSKTNKLVDKQIQGQQLTNDGISLGNIAAFEQIAHRAISDKYATYHSKQLGLGLSPDVSAFFADDANFEDIIPSYAPSNNPMYRNALSRVRQGSESIIADAYSISNDKVSSQSSLARVLANPWYDDDTKLMAASLSPLMEAIFKLEESTSSFNQQVIDFKKTYVGALNAETLAENYELTSNYQKMVANHQSIIEGAKSYVYSNLRTIYENGPYSPAGFRAANLIMGQAPNSMADFLTQYLATLVDPTLMNEFHDYMDMDGDPVTNEGGIGWHSGRPSR